jgi:trans-2,3-dihydro-3-hydroxyanthranilate isomerase
MKKIKIFQIDAFTKKPYLGNAAGVAFGDNLSTKQMQKIANEMNLSETAFLTKLTSTSGRSKKADYKLRWFTPVTEVDLCGHATIASLHFLNENKLLKKNAAINFETKCGILKCFNKSDLYFMQIPVFKMKFYQAKKKKLLNVLGIKGSELGSLKPFVLVENGYLFVHVKKLSTLKNLKPDFEKLKSFVKNKISGFTVFTLETFDRNSFVHSRFYAPAFGINEDPVTGSSNGPLLLVLHKLGLINLYEKETTELTFEQGDFIGRNGIVKVQYNRKSNELYIAGNAATVLKGELTI